jgi:hypothetical protein
MEPDDDGYVIEYEPDADETERNVFGVVPVEEGNVPYDADDGQWEYEYVYEEVDADEDWNDEYIDPKAHYVEEVNIEAGGDWEAEEDWEDNGADEYESDDEDFTDEEYEYDYEEEYEEDRESGGR